MKKGKVSMPVVLSLTSTAISVIIGGSAILGNIQRSDNGTVDLGGKISQTEAQVAFNTQAIKELQSHSVAQDKHLTKIDTNVNYLVKQFDNITEIKVKRSTTEV